MAGICCHFPYSRGSHHQLMAKKKKKKQGWVCQYSSTPRVAPSLAGLSLLRLLAGVPVLSSPSLHAPYEDSEIPALGKDAASRLPLMACVCLFFVRMYVKTCCVHLRVMM